MAAHLYDAMSAARQAGRNSVLEQTERTVANSVSFAYDVRNIRAEARMRAIAFTIAGVENQGLLDAIQAGLEQSFKDGKLFADFQDTANELFDSYGVTRLKRHHLETVYRNNLQTSYNTGRYDALTEPAMKSEFPMWQYDAIDDEDTRPAHRAMDGKVYPADDPIWDEWYPPNGHKCRCSVSAISRDEVEQDNIKPSEPPLPTTVPDKGFEQNPAKGLKWLDDFVKEKL